ncbi:hypothetical protein IFM89_032493 [Coptis chinensis]|uniref:Bifunctional inhibitor/plant lipid transfer protein/seed storage helical domain-containing protein n=1 Tax=Coptis chinensis TaxID=261450 RepID=A0A835IS51_9MAGN|nr:hypothetical protein IFM89_032493 [Coptis chinensis]
MRNPLISPLLLLLTISHTISFTSSAITTTCTNELTSISPCLPYISSPPNNLTLTPSLQCCHQFSSTFVNQTSVSCLCYLLREPMILGFPLNTSRIVSLPSFCFTENVTSTDDLEIFCSVAPALPPLEATSGSGSEDDSPSPSPSTPWESDAPAPSPASSSPGINSRDSSTVKPAQNSGCHQFLPPMILLILIHLCSSVVLLV